MSNHNDIIIDEEGDKRWYLDGKLHRTDGPAVECADGTKYWYLNGKRHRIDGPTVIDSAGNKWWYLNGDRHRVDGPAVESIYGVKEWWINGERLGEGKTGFWALWDRLDDQQRSNLSLHMYGVELGVFA